MAIDLYNPHVDDFVGAPLQFKLFRRRALRKYGFLLDLVRAKQIRIVFDSTCSGLIPEKLFVKIPKFVRTLICRLEIFVWAVINRVDNKMIVEANRVANLERHVIFSFSYKSSIGLFDERISFFETYKISIFHLSHYFILTKLKSGNISKLNNARLAADSALSDSPFFKNFFFWYRFEVLVMPFYVADRFKIKTIFAGRSDRCVATGTFHDLSKEKPASYYQDFRGFTRLNTYHPTRQKVHSRAAAHKNLIDSYVSPFRERNPKGGWSPFVLLSKYSSRQKKYFKLDIVSLYNRYKLSFVGEEQVGLPPIGLFEAMRSGAVAIANPQVLGGLPLVAGVHYLPYDGSYEGLCRAIQHGLSLDTKELEKISSVGAALIDGEFNRRNIATKWMNILVGLS